MGLYAHLLEFRGSPLELLPLYSVLGQSRPFGLPLEPPSTLGVLRLLPSGVLGVGHDEQPEEPVQAGGARDVN